MNKPLARITEVKGKAVYGHYKIMLNTEASSMIGSTHIVFDKVNIRFKEAGIDDTRCYKLTRIGGCSNFTSRISVTHDPSGQYEIEEEDGYFQLYRV